MRIAMFVIATREHGRAGEAGVLDVVAVKAAVLEQLVAGPDWRVVEPPFLATEDQTRVRNLADAGRVDAVAIISCPRERMRRDDASEIRLAAESLRPSQQGAIPPQPNPPP